MVCLAVAEPLVGLGAVGGRGQYIHTPVHPNIYLTLGEREGEGERERAHLEVAKKEGLLPVCKSGSL